MPIGRLELHSYILPCRSKEPARVVRFSVLSLYDAFRASFSADYLGNKGSFFGDPVILILAINDPGQLLHFVLSPALCGEVQPEIVHVQKDLQCSDTRCVP